MKKKYLHCIYFFANDQAARLRGQEWFEMRQRILGRFWSLSTPIRWLVPKLRTHKPQGYIRVSRTTFPIECTQAMLFICMPSHGSVPQILRDFKSYGSVVVVDIVADIFGKTDPDDASPQSKGAAASVPQENWEWWTTSERRQIVLDCLNEASIITTSFPEYIGWLRELTGYRTPVFHLPDVTETNMSDFHNSMKTVIRAAGYDL